MSNSKTKTLKLTLSYSAVYFMNDGYVIHTA